MALESVPNARVTLEAGFTTVRDVGVYRALNDIALRDAIARGDFHRADGCTWWARMSRLPVAQAR